MSYTWDVDQDPEPTSWGISNEEWEDRFGESHRRAGLWTAVINLLVIAYMAVFYAIGQDF